MCFHCLRFLEKQWNWQAKQSLHQPKNIFLYGGGRELQRWLPAQTSAFQSLDSLEHHCYLWPRNKSLKVLDSLYIQLIGGFQILPKSFLITLNPLPPGPWGPWYTQRSPRSVCSQGNLSDSLGLFKTWKITTKRPSLKYPRLTLNSLLHGQWRPWSSWELGL